MALTLTCIHSCVAARSFAATAAWIVGTTSVATAIITGSWMPCLGALLVFPALGAGPVWRLLQFRRWRMELRALFADEARLQSFVSLAARLDWESISQCRKDALLRSLVAGPANVEALNPVRAPG
jgi:hypothetical protein